MVQERYLGVLTGEVGSGKSALLRRLTRSLDPMKTLPIYLGQAGLKPRDFYAELLRHVGEESPYGVAKAKRLWQEVVLQRQAQGERGIIVILDEAHEMTEAMLLELRFVMSYHMDSCSLFPVILAGQPELRKLLRLKKYEAIAQRIGMQYHLAGMTRDETSAYIRHHLNTAGLTRPVFSESAMHMVYSASQGIPRVVNQICGQALFDAQGKGHDAVEEAHVGRVLSDLDRQRGATG
ncbi:ExeA family protein [Paenibacillus cremeus]|uniref:ExeA family protein n=1 Tax=Paenibacillus cremeus TaxID=2163881 RepID=UPI0021BDE63F|nr:AAA family ATPase [Paenibacillus cremeus]